MRRVHFPGFEGAVRGAVVEAVGDGLAVRGEFPVGGVGEDIEALAGDEQRLGEFEQDGLDLGVRPRRGETFPLPPALGCQAAGAADMAMVVATRIGSRGIPGGKTACPHASSYSISKAAASDNCHGQPRSSR